MIEANEVNSTFYALRLLSHGVDTSQIEVTDGEEYPASEFTKEEQEQALKFIHDIEDQESVSTGQLPAVWMEFYRSFLAGRIEKVANSDLANAGYAVETTAPSRDESPETDEPPDADPMMQEELEKLDFYITQGYSNIALDTLELLERQFGSHPEIDVRHRRLRANQSAKADSVATTPENIRRAARAFGTFGTDEGGISDREFDQPGIAMSFNSVDPRKRAAAVAALGRSRLPDAFSLITNWFDDRSPHVRNAAARALCDLEPARRAELFKRALEDASPERRRNIGGAIADSGLATEAIDDLIISVNREDTYNALSILFVMARTGEVEPLVRALEEPPNDEIRKAIAKVLMLSGHPEAVATSARRRP